MRRSRLILVSLAVLAAGAAGAVTWRALRAASPQAGAGPELAMPAPERISEQAEPSSLGMVKRDEEPAAPPPKPAPPLPRRVPKPAPASVPENEPALAVPGQAPPGAPIAAKRPPRLQPMPNWHHLLGTDDEDENGKPIVHYLQPAAPAQVQPQAQAAAKPPPPPALKTDDAAPPPPAPPPPPPKRGYRPSPPPANPVQTGPTTAVSAAPPAQQETADNPLPPPVQTQAEITNVTFVTRGASDTPPPPNPVAPNATGSACLKAGAWKNSWTGVCYDTRDSCQQAQPNGQCVQPVGVARKAGPTVK